MKKILIVEGNLREENQSFTDGGIKTHTESLKDSIASISSDEGVIYTGNPQILKKVCPGTFGVIRPVGYCMIGQK